MYWQRKQKQQFLHTPKHLHKNVFQMDAMRKRG